MKKFSLLLLVLVSIYGCNDTNENTHPSSHDVFLDVSWANPDLLSTINLYDGEDLIHTIDATNRSSINIAMSPIKEHPADYEFCIEPVFLDSTYSKNLYVSFYVQLDQNQSRKGSRGDLTPGDKRTITGSIL